MHFTLAGGTERLCYAVGRKKETLHSTVIRPVKGCLYSIMFVINITNIINIIKIIICLAS